MPEIIDTILSRRSIRHFTPEPVDHETLVLLLKAAMSAPTACNSQPWEFIVATEQEVLDRIRDKFLFARYNAPAAIVVCGNVRIANNSAARDHWVMDCSAATENILIAAAGMGFGAVWIGVYPYPSRIKILAELLGIPENVTPLSMVYVGHPAEQKEPRTHYDEHRVYWQCYEPRKRRSKIKNAKYLP
ncbi:MAG TPA: nitroreductase family protein [Anaerolineales bacterium]|nr:nitroreductase family protein [Anaerolineales bacterium]